MKKNVMFLIFFAMAMYFSVVALASWTPKNPEIFFSPDKENEKIVSEFVGGAEEELLVEAYSLTNEVIFDSIKRVKSNGVDVRIVCDKANFKKKNDFCQSLGGKPDKKSGLMHNKVMVRDRECVLTGSFNFTGNAVRNNRENFIIFCDKGVAEVYAKEFLKIEKNNT